MPRHLKAALGALALIVATATHGHALTTLFEDSFNRTDNRNIDAELTGITNNTGTALGADNVYIQPWLDPVNRDPGDTEFAAGSGANPGATIGAQDGNAANGGGAQILANRLQLAVGQGTSNAIIDHNFTNAVILADGGLKISFDILAYNQSTSGQGAGFGFGFSRAEGITFGDAVGNGANNPALTEAFQDSALLGSDFYLALRGDSMLAWGTADTSLGGTRNLASVAAKTGSIAAVFGISNFNAGSLVTYEVFYGATSASLTSMGAGTFQWSGTNQAYIGVDTRDNTAVQIENLKIETVLPPPKPTLFINRDNGNITLSNTTSGAQSISSYSIITADGAFNQSNWNKVDVLDTNDAWFTFTAPSSVTDLAEGTVAVSGSPGEYTIAAQNPGTTDDINFGNVWVKSPFEDIQFELRDSTQAGNEIAAIVQFIGGPSFEIGDLNTDRQLNAADWIVLRNNLGKTLADTNRTLRYRSGDMNNDGLVNQLDFREFKNSYTAALGENAFAALFAVPEPGSVAMAVIAGVALFGARSNRRNVARLASVAALVGMVGVNSASADILFEDNFNRPDDRNIDAVLTGITNNTGSALPADAVYEQSWLDPANRDPGDPGSPPLSGPNPGGTVGVQDALPENGGGAQILANQLELAVGAGTSNAYVNHNFVNSSITAAKGFRVSIAVGNYSQTADAQGAAIGIGMSASEADAGMDATQNFAAGTTPEQRRKFTNAFPNTGTADVLSDFYFGLRGNSTMAWGSGGFGAPNPSTVAVTAKTGVISAEFSVNNFNAGSQVAYEVFYNGGSVGIGTFKWSGNMENFIGIDARDAAQVQLDNYRVETVTGLVPKVLKLQINTTSGEAFIVGGGAANILDYYEITSAAGSLLSANFNGIRGDAGNVPAGNNDGLGWEIGGGGTPNPNLVTEAFLSGNSTIGVNQSAMSVGQLFNGGTQDVVFRYTSSAGTIDGLVEYISGVNDPDFNNDLKVDGFDFLIWQRNFNATGANNGQGDANDDHTVNAADLALWRSAFGTMLPSAVAAPEPATSALSIAALLAMAARWRRRT